MPSLRLEDFLEPLRGAVTRSGAEHRRGHQAQRGSLPIRMRMGRPSSRCGPATLTAPPVTPCDGSFAPSRRCLRPGALRLPVRQVGGVSGTDSRSMGERFRVLFWGQPSVTHVVTRCFGGHQRESGSQVRIQRSAPPMMCGTNPQHRGIAPMKPHAALELFRLVLEIVLQLRTLVEPWFPMLGV